MKKIILLTTILILASCRNGENEPDLCNCHEQDYYREMVYDPNNNPVQTGAWTKNPPGETKKYNCSENGRESPITSFPIGYLQNGNLTVTEKKTVIECK